MNHASDALSFYSIIISICQILSLSLVLPIYPQNTALQPSIPRPSNAPPSPNLAKSQKFHTKQTR
ncbi:hypothetical protein BDV41DRAFT_527133 [Aspergillus transmontanensis]|uniref:Uncharacterized protein n=1 Tax=Aspergillus transmontanensis TaxID=1034304 RepID=A0A5N6W7V8_9EURO|nr:hypothetical protein BDV41DRAFT_527133 [Aspergillus transmontanensis]